MERPDSVICISYNLKLRAYCGRDLTNKWHFDSYEAAWRHVESVAKFEPCSECLSAIRKLKGEYENSC